MHISPLTSWLLDATLRGSALILFLWLLRPFLRRWLGARATHLLWLVVLLQLLVPWLPKSPLSLLPIRSEAQASAPAVTSNVRMSVSVEEAPSRSSASPSAAAAPASRPVPYLLLIWGLGAAGIGAFSVLRAVRATRLVRRAPEIGNQALLQEVLAELPRVPRRLRICATRELRSPALCGILRPTILLPEGWAEQLSQEELRCVLQHEIGHLRRGDLIWHWAFLIARAVHWFNPLVWLAEKSARADQEMACDEWVLAHSTTLDEQTYGEVLLKASLMLGAPRLTSPLHATMAETKAGLTRRIRHLAEIRPHGWFATAAAIVLAVSLLLIVAPSQSTAQAAPSGTPVAPTTPPEEARPLPSSSTPAGTSEVIAQQTQPGTQQVEIAVKLVELSAKAGQPVDAKDAIEAVLKHTFGDPPVTPRIESVLNAEQYAAVVRNMNQQYGTDIITAPRVTTKAGQRVVIEIIREFRYPTEFEQENDGTGFVTPRAFETRNTGLTVEAEPEILPDGRIELLLTPQIVEFLGFVNYRANRPARPEKVEDALSTLLEPAKADHVLNQPIFDTRKITTTIVLKSGQTALVGGMDRNIKEVVDQEEERGITSRVLKPIFKPMLDGSALTKKIERSLFMFVTARIVPAQPEQQSGHSPQAATTVKDFIKTMGVPPLAPQLPTTDSKNRAGTPVPGKPGFVTSPYAPTAGYVDVRGFPTGTEVKCPFSGKMFLVP